MKDRDYLIMIGQQLIGIDFDDLTKCERNIANILVKAGYMKKDGIGTDCIKLKFVEAKPATDSCEKCGNPTFGRLCAKCKGEQ